MKRLFKAGITALMATTMLVGCGTPSSKSSNEKVKCIT